MANVFVNLPAPAGDGVGAGQTTTALDLQKTATIQDAFRGTVLVEASLDGGTTWAQVAAFTTPGRATFEHLAQLMRVRRAGVPNINPGLPNVDIGAVPNAATFVNLPAPAGDGVGAAVDVSGLGPFKTITSLGTYTGSVLIEISEDNVSWAQNVSFPDPGILSNPFTARFVRVRRTGVNPNMPGLPVVNLAAVPAIGDSAIPTLPLELVFDDNDAQLDVFVDGVNGDDGNDGRTSSTALRTIGEVYRKFPWQAMGGTRILVNLLNPNSTELVYNIFGLHMGGGNTSQQNTYAFRGPQMILFTPSAGPSSAALDATPATVVTQAQVVDAAGTRTRFNFTTAAPGWTVNDLGGSFIRITRGGNLVIFEVPITENTADAIFVDCLGIVGTVLSTDTAEVVRPAVSIESPNDPVTVRPIITIWGETGTRRYDNADEVDTRQRYSTFERISFGTFQANGIGWLTFDRCLFKNISTRIPEFQYWTVGFANTVSHIGMTLTQTMSAIAICRRDNPGVSPLITTSRTDLQIAPPAGVPANGSLRFGGILGSSNLYPQSATWFTFQRPLSVYRGNVGGVFIVGPGSQLVSAASAGRLLGRDNTGGPGLRCFFGSLARIRGGDATAGSACSITGTGGDLQVNSGAAVAYGTAVGQFREVAGWNGRICRAPEAVVGNPGDHDQSRITIQTT